MTQHAYLFQAKGIQRYILEGGKLKDMVGASELVDRLCRSDENDLLEKVLNAVGFPRPHSFSRRAGGVFMLHYSEAEEAATKRFRALWRLAVAMAVPGLEFVEAVCSEHDGEPEDGDNPFIRALSAAYRRVGLRENSLASLLPMAGPLAKRAQRTGLAAVPAAAKYRDREDNEEIDAATLRKRKMERLLWDADAASGVALRMTPPDMATPLCWPRNMETPPNAEDPREAKRSFPFLGRKRWVGVIHADISGLGELFQRLNESLATGDNPARTSLKTSRKIEEAMSAAARQATEQVLVPRALEHGGVVPARPILLGGDDLTVIVRADLAIDFAETFLKALEQHQVNDHQLTACAGIAFLKANQPFYMASRLAEDLCKYAKSEVKKKLEDGSVPKPVPSAIAFHRITSSLIDDYDDILKRTRTIAIKGDDGNGEADWKYVLTRQPYLVGTSVKPGLARLADLRILRDWIDSEGVSVGPLRNLESLLFNNFADAKKGYARWKAGMEDKEGVSLPGFEEPLAKLLNDDLAKDLPFDKANGAMRSTPLFDALDWREVA